MKIAKNRLAKLLGTFFAMLLLSAAAFCQSGPPAPPPDPSLGAYYFDDTNWLSLDGDAPIAFSNLVSFPLWSRNALLLDTTNLTPAYLNYYIIETNDGSPNLDFSTGALKFSFISDWATADTNQYGMGPGDWAFLIGAGDFSSGSPDGLWAVYLDPGGTNIYFGGVSNSVSTVFVSAPISWPANSIHLVGIEYTSTNSTMYLDGQLAATGDPVTIVPATNVWTNGFFVGSDASGYEQAQGLFWYMEFFNSNFFNTNWSDIFNDSYFTNGWLNLSNNFATWLAAQGGGFHFDSGDDAGWTPPPTPTNTVNTNYADYTNFWLLVTNNSTNAYVNCVNTLSNITYEILTNRNLASTNWGIWHTFLASNCITPMPSISLSSNAMFFQGRLVWSTGTNGLPDWWQMLYFDQLGVNPSGNPAGDGIDNLNKYILGLNPNISYVSQLVIAPLGGNYITMPTVTVFSLTGASIKYTTNGSTPSATNGLTIASGVSITNLPNGNFTLKAWESGLTPNVPVSATYTIIPAPPTFSLPTGLYASNTTLQISCATTNATVRYTTNGIDPTTNSTQIQPTNIITLTTNQTIKATAWLGTNASPMASASYIVEGPPVNDNYSNAIVLSGSSGSFSGSLFASTTEAFELDNPSAYFFWADFSGNSVWYQWTAPSNGNVIFDCSKCDYSFILTAYDFPATNGPNPTNLVPAGFENLGGGDYSDEGSNYDQGPYYYPNSDNTSYTLIATQDVTYWFSASDSGNPKVPFQVSWQYVGASVSPIFSPDAGTYLTAQTVTVSDNDSNAVIHYTLDGSTPTTNNSVIVSGASLLINTNTTLKAAAWRPGLSESAVKTALYTINASSTNPTLTASMPTLSPGNTNFASSLAITLTCTNAGAVIYYTTDGSIPTSASANVSSGGTVTLTNSTLFNASAWVTNMNFSSITTGWYAKNGVDTTGDGILDSGALFIGTDPFVSDANAVNPNPSAHGLDNLQVYLNQSVLTANNYSTENDGIPDWWLVQNGYSVTTSANAIGANGQTLLTDYVSGLNPNNPNSIPGQLPPIDFHMVPGPSNNMVMVLDAVPSGMASYVLTCWNTDQGLPAVVTNFAADQSLDQPGNKFGRYFQVTNNVSPGYWYFTLQGVNSNSLLSQISSNTFISDSQYNEWVPYLIGPAEYDYRTSYSGLPIPVVGYTNKNDLKEPLLAQMLRQESDVSVNGIVFEGAPDGWSVNPVVYNDLIPLPITTEASWGTLTFTNYYYSYYAIDFASYFTSYCATPDSPYDCSDYYSNWWGGLPGSGLTPLQTDIDASTNYYFIMPTNTFNPAGLAYLSLTYRIGDNDPVTLYPGQSNIVPTNGFAFEVALDTETPTFQPTNYYFDARQYPLQDEDYYAQRSSPPVQSPDLIADGWMAVGLFNEEVAPTSVTNPVIIAQVGKPVNLQSWSEVMAVRPNGDPITNQTYFIDQDFAQAYLCDPATGDVPRSTSQTNYNGKFKINTNTAIATGILSPSLDYTNVALDNGYFGQRGASFTPTQPGKVIVTTMPDSNGFYGEVTIYVIDMQVDANHDGVMDNRDLTSGDNPIVFWVNNDYDRVHTVLSALGGGTEQDDMQPGTNGFPANSQPDSFYYDPTTGSNAIPSQRDLEDYTRLWIPGLSNLMQELPTNYGANLQWRNGTGAAIRLFRASEDDGGTNYLFDTNIATLQTNYTLNPCYGYVGANQPLSLSTAFASTTVPVPSDYFIFCGAEYGNDELVLQVTNQYGGEVGEASVFINLKDIKQMYERWTVGDNPSNAPLTTASLATNDLPSGVGSFQYSYDPSLDSATPYIVFVHGWNMQTWEKDRFAETAFKRLYWQGYQNRFGTFRWPTTYFSANLTTYDSGEWIAWQSGQPFESFLTGLNDSYPGKVYVMAHSMGNVVTGEALRLAGSSQIVNTYVASQAAVSARAYDNTIPPDATNLYLAVYTPDTEGHYYTNGAPPYFNGIGGAAFFVDYYNHEDWVLDKWVDDQNGKPDIGYNWTIPSTNYPSGYYYQVGFGSPRVLLFGTNTYEIFAKAVQSYSLSLGAETDVGARFSAGVNLDEAPFNFGGQYVGHSAQFRSDIMTRAVYWQQLLSTFNIPK